MSLLKHVIAVAMLVTLTAGTAGGQEANYSREGADTCLACHENEAVLPLFKGPHANPTDPNGPFGHGQLQCEACHGPTGDHAGRVRRGQERTAPGIIFGANSTTPIDVQNGERPGAGYRNPARGVLRLPSAAANAVTKTVCASYSPGEDGLQRLPQPPWRNERITIRAADPE